MAGAGRRRGCPAVGSAPVAGRWPPPAGAARTPAAPRRPAAPHPGPPGGVVRRRWPAAWWPCWPGPGWPTPAGRAGSRRSEPCWPRCCSSGWSLPAFPAGRAAVACTACPSDGEAGRPVDADHGGQRARPDPTALPGRAGGPGGGAVPGATRRSRWTVTRTGGAWWRRWRWRWRRAPPSGSCGGPGRSRWPSPARCTWPRGRGGPAPLETRRDNASGDAPLRVPAGRRRAPRRPPLPVRGRPPLGALAGHLPHRDADGAGDGAPDRRPPRDRRRAARRPGGGRGRVRADDGHRRPRAGPGPARWCSAPSRPTATSPGWCGTGSTSVGDWPGRAGPATDPTRCPAPE